MFKTLLSAIFLLSAQSCLPVCAQSVPASFPDKQLAKFVVDHLDVTSFPSSIGYRCQPNKHTFADYGFATKELSCQKATLESITKDWLFEVVVLHHDKSSITVCVHDISENSGSFNTESILQLHATRTRDRLIATDSSWIAAGF